jgi:phenylacetate-CoA ligase
MAFGRTLYRGRLEALREEQRRYAAEPPSDEIRRLQLARLNSVWSHCLECVPFYQWWAKEHELPPRFTDLSQLRQFPRVTKAVLREHADEVFEGGRVKSSVLTGGSTGAPVRYPWSASDAATAFANMYTGRGWWGIRPFDAQVAFWGHGHAFGTDWRRHVRAAKRGIGYLTSNTVTLSAYELGSEAMSSQYRRLRRRRPAYLYGYTSAVFRFAKHLETNSLPVPFSSPLKGVIMTSETVTLSDLALVERVFSAPAIVEYGAAEIGPVAYSSPGRSGLRVFWTNFIVQADDEGHAVITTTGDRRFPLINYDIGDVIDVGHDQSESLLELPGIRGREADVVRMRTRTGGTREVIGRFLVHVMKSHPAVLAIQIRQGDAGRIHVYLTTHAPLDTAAARDHLLRQVTSEYPDVATDSVTVHQVSEPILTPAGKTRLLV